MDATTYLAAWLLAALAVIGLLSALLTRHRRRADLRCLQAQRLLEALQRHADWVCAQRLVAVLQAGSDEAEAALRDAGAIQQAAFPELADGMAQLATVHSELLAFLSAQRSLWLNDPQQWLDSDHDQRFMALWLRHRQAMQLLHARLQQVAGVRIATAAPRGQALGAGRSPLDNHNEQWRTG